MTVVACLFAAIALGQIASLKSDIAVLRREILPLKAGLGKLELAEKARKESEQDGVSKNVGSKQSGSDEEQRSNDVEPVRRGNSVDKGLYQAGPFR